MSLPSSINRNLLSGFRDLDRLIAVEVLEQIKYYSILLTMSLHLQNRRGSNSTGTENNLCVQL